VLVMKDMVFQGRNKRGVSPLIATILLIAFAVALGAVVMNWGRNVDTLGGLDPTQKCAAASLKVDAISDVPQIFYGGEGTNGFVEFTIENNGNEDISGLIVWIVGEIGTKVENLGKVEIKVGYPFKKKLSYNFNKYGNIRKVRFIPQLIIDEELFPCSDYGIDEERISKSV